MADLNAAASSGRSSPDQGNSESLLSEHGGQDTETLAGNGSDNQEDDIPDFLSTQQEADVNLLDTQEPADESPEDEVAAEDEQAVLFTCAADGTQSFKIPIISKEMRATRIVHSIGTGNREDAPVTNVIVDEARRAARLFSVISSHTASVLQVFSGFKLTSVGRNGLTVTREGKLTIVKAGSTIHLEHGDTVHFGMDPSEGEGEHSGLAFTVSFPNDATVGAGRRTGKAKKKVAAQEASERDEAATAQDAARAAKRSPGVTLMVDAVTETAAALIETVGQTNSARGAKALVGQACKALSAAASAVEVEGHKARGAKRQARGDAVSEEKRARVEKGVKRRGEAFQQAAAAQQQRQQQPKVPHKEGRFAGQQVNHKRKLNTKLYLGKGGMGKGAGVGKGFGKGGGGKGFSSGGKGFGGSTGFSSGGKGFGGGTDFSSGGKGFGGGGGSGFSSGGKWLGDGGGKGKGSMGFGKGGKGPGGGKSSGGKGGKGKGGKGKGGGGKGAVQPTFACTLRKFE